MEDLLQESELTLTATVTNAGAKKQPKNQSQIAAQEHNKESITNVQDVVEHNKRVAAFTAQHMTEFVHVATRWAILPEFAEARRGHTSKYQSVTALNLQPCKCPYIQLS